MPMIQRQHFFERISSMIYFLPFGLYLRYFNKAFFRQVIKHDTKILGEVHQFRVLKQFSKLPQFFSFIT